MIEDYSSDLLRSGIIEFKAGNRQAARRYLDRALYMSGSHEVMAEGWYWMSQLSDDPVEKRQALENCLSHDLRHAHAAPGALAILDGKLKPDEIIDPEAPVLRRQRDQEHGQEVQRFMCPKCGGRMHFAPDGQSLVCDYCARHEVAASERYATGQPPWIEKDFLIAMATARGHGKPLAEQVFHCQGCGARFIVPLGNISITCPYCASPHVVCLDKSPDLIAPDGILPHAFDEARAASLLRDWLKKSGSPLARAAGPLRPLYLPLWTFDIGGTIDYSGEVVEQPDVGYTRRAPRVVPVSDSYPVMLSRLPIPASRKLSAPFVRLLPSFDLKALQPYDPRYLADWPAELYDIPMAEASLDARSQGYSMLKRDMEIRLSPVRVLSTSSSNLTIESFDLDLLPVWMTEINVPAEAGDPTSGGSHLVLINGQTGEMYGDLASKPSHSGRLPAWLSDLIGE